MQHSLQLTHRARAMVIAVMLSLSISFISTPASAGLTDQEDGGAADAQRHDRTMLPTEVKPLWLGTFLLIVYWLFITHEF